VIVSVFSRDAFGEREIEDADGLREVGHAD